MTEVAWRRGRILGSVDLHRLGISGRRGRPREGDRVHGHVVDREVAHLEGGREHRRLERTPLGDALVKVERLGELVAEVGLDALLHRGDAHRSADDLDARDLRLGET